MRITVTVGIAIGIALRVAILCSSIGSLDADEAVVGLMARHLLRGEHPVMFWGQAYGGIHEQAIAAVVFAVTTSTVLALKIVPIGLTAGASLVLWRVGLRLVGRQAAAVAAVAYWIAPAAFVWGTTKERGFYEATMLLGLVVWLLCLRLAQEERPAARERPDAIGLGLAAGLAWWASPQSLYLCAPALLWLIVRRRQAIGIVILVAVAGVAGASPWLVYNIRHGWASFHIPPVIHTTAWHRFGSFFSVGLPVALGWKTPYSARWVVPWLAPIAFVVEGALIVGRGTRSAVRHSPIPLALLAYPLIFTASPYSFYVREPRYLFFLSPLVALVLADMVRKVHLPAVLVLSSLAVLGLAQMTVYGDETPGAHDLATPSTAALRRALNRRHITRAFGDYWASYTTTFESHERILVSPVVEPRYHPYDVQVRQQPSPPYVMFADSPIDRRLQQALTDRSIPFERVLAGHYALYLPGTRVLPEQLAAVW